MTNMLKKSILFSFVIFVSGCATSSSQNYITSCDALNASQNPPSAITADTMEEFAQKMGYKLDSTGSWNVLNSNSTPELSAENAPELLVETTPKKIIVKQTKITPNHNVPLTKKEIAKLKSFHPKSESFKGDNGVSRNFLSGRGVASFGSKPKSLYRKTSSTWKTFNSPTRNGTVPALQVD